MRKLIFFIDALLRKKYGVFEFSDEEDCMLRLQVTPAWYALNFPDLVVQAGEPVLILHTWNEHIQPISASGADLAWARVFYRGFLKSLQAVAGQMKQDPRLADIRAVGAETILLVSGDRDSGIRVFSRAGFTILPSSESGGLFGEFWENLYSWLLLWAYNPGSIRYRSFFHMERVGFWMPADDFLERFGASGT